MSTDTMPCHKCSGYTYLNYEEGMFLTMCMNCGEIRRNPARCPKCATLDLIRRMNDARD